MTAPETPDHHFDPTEPSVIERLLATAFGVSVSALDRLAVGQATVNYRATTNTGRVFVKAYPAGTDLAQEAAGIRLSVLAGRAGIPVACPLSLGDGTFIARHEGSAASVWEWIDGAIIETGYNQSQLHVAGHTLGLIHRTFATLLESNAPAPEAEPWLAFNAPEFTAIIDRLLAIIEAKNEPDEFDRSAWRTLRERREQVERVPSLIAGLPPLTTQVLHGDYSPMNLMFAGDGLAAVIDFRPPDPFFIAYELGRIAYDPRSVTRSPDWQTDALALIAAYRRANPQVAPDAIACSARVALIQLLTSLYGVRNHYLKPGLLQDGLDAFWLQRHHAATTLLHHLHDLEKALHAYTAVPATGYGQPRSC